MVRAARHWDYAVLDHARGGSLALGRHLERGVDRAFERVLVLDVAVDQLGDYRLLLHAALASNRLLGLLSPLEKA